MPSDGVPDESRHVWIQLLKTVMVRENGGAVFLLQILQSRFNKAEVWDTQETDRVVRLAKAHTDLVLLDCNILVNRTSSCWVRDHDC